MSELLQVAAGLSRAGRDGQMSVLATVVRTEGSTYRRIGARLVAFPDGTHVGAVSAGCIETDVLLRAERVRESGRVELASYDTRSPEDLVWGSGTACGGRSELLLEPLDPERAAAKAEWLREVAQLRGRSVVGTVIRGSRLPVAAGDQAVFPQGGAGLSGLDELPAQLLAVVEATARHQLRVRSSAAVLHAWADTELDIAYEVRAPVVRLCVCGAGPDAAPLVAQARWMGWQVTVIDDRDGAAAIGRADCDAAVVMSHNYDRDLVQLGALVAAGVSYVGVLGPRRRALRMIEDLRVSQIDTGRLYAPAGLDIGGETAEEIALAIVAEVQAVMAGRTGGSLRERRGAIHEEPLMREAPAVAAGWER
jgi:xanthine dehydrogenase accessory factor